MKTIFSIFTTGLIFLASCSLERLSDPGTVDADIRDDFGHDMIVLGDKLEDPYTVSNMTRAISSLYPTRTDRTRLEPTDWYVRMLPGDLSEFDALADMGIVMLDHPLDHEIVREGDWYHDPEVPEDDITWQYALVPVDFAFPEGLKWEILDDCYLPENDPSTKADGLDWDAVEAESYRITGNAHKLSGPLTRGDNAYEPTIPSGRISIIDKDIDDEPIGVKGVEVVCNSFVKIAKCTTDDAGYWTASKKFSTDIRYRLLFSNSNDFRIGMNLILVPASTSNLGKHGPEGLNIVIDESSDRRLFTRCVVNNAGFDWVEKCRAEGMSLPPASFRIWLMNKLPTGCPLMMHQGALIDDSFVSDMLGEYSFVVKMFLPDAIIGLKSKEDYASIYAEATHFFAHASHFRKAGVEWWNRYLGYLAKSFVTSGFVTYGSGTESDAEYCGMAEMWAYYVQTQVNRMRYSDSDKVFGTQWWFTPQIFLYLDDRGIGMASLLEVLSGDVDGREMLKKKLLSMYPEYKTNINQAFIRY